VVESQPSKLLVAGSIPVSRSRNPIESSAVSTVDLSDGEANVPINADKFARPAPAVVRQIKAAPSGAPR
jgi:hypothetical protein